MQALEKGWQCMDEFHYLKAWYVIKKSGVCFQAIGLCEDDINSNCTKYDKNPDWGVEAALRATSIDHKQGNAGNIFLNGNIIFCSKSAENALKVPVCMQTGQPDNYIMGQEEPHPEEVNGVSLSMIKLNSINKIK